jgi:hypothetical protein
LRQTREIKKEPIKSGKMCKLREVSSLLQKEKVKRQFKYNKRNEFNDVKGSS